MTSKTKIESTIKYLISEMFLISVYLFGRKKKKRKSPQLKIAEHFSLEFDSPCKVKNTQWHFKT